MAQILEQTRQAESDFLPLNGTDYVEFYVGNARQAAHYYRTAFGFSLVAYCGPETGVRDRASYVLMQDKIRFVLTTPLQPDGDIAAHVRLHGDGVRDVALWVDDAEAAWRATTSRGARSVREPETLRDARGEVRIAAIAIYGETIHSFVERRNYQGAFLPGYEAVTAADIIARPAGLRYIDHMVGNVGWGEMNRWVDFY
ncbi:MAG: VOC family protein, partial [Candidatus Solibacter sp.]